MGTNLTTKELTQVMDKIVDKVLDNLKSWDGTIESGISIIEANEIDLDELRTISLQLTDPSITYEEKYLKKFNEILLEHNKLTSSLKMEQDQLRVLMQQINKKDQIINNYISINKQPMFIDKDIN